MNAFTSPHIRACAITDTNTHTYAHTRLYTQSCTCAHTHANTQKFVDQQGRSMCLRLSPAYKRPGVDLVCSQLIAVDK